MMQAEHPEVIPTADPIFPTTHSLWPAFERWRAEAKPGGYWRDLWQTFIAGADHGVRHYLDTRGD
jgi:hypothetical protein